ncbi:2Fe-2S ferredoxin [Anaerosporomusa subterranea]|uniref:2Fe-2S ferredoxin n=1 Tax=Anaerosporomusa subterranea TaxID=1794912 RepID=A0A154BVV7_ANASB|nr:2Fe-2S ferredoxin [Anaerosporomusa subterranea]KYZ78072.1 2Fe-2S ferredoxin [Anaerosporomusa subterranea]
MNKPNRHIFVCTSSRPTGQQKGMCLNKEGVSVMMKFMEEIGERDLGGDVAITNTGCFGLCEQGPIVVVYPDNVWYKKVSADDVEEIMDKHIEGGEPVTRLLI